MEEIFRFKERGEDNVAIVFETLGKSLYDFIKANNYKGMTRFMLVQSSFCLTVASLTEQTLIHVIRIFTGINLRYCQVVPHCPTIPSLHQPHPH